MAMAQRHPRLKPWIISALLLIRVGSPQRAHYPSVLEPFYSPGFLLAESRTLPHIGQPRFMSTPRIKLKVDRALDVPAEIEHKLKPIFKIRDLILKQEDQTASLKYVVVKGDDLGLRAKSTGACGFMKRYPNIFEIYMPPRCPRQRCRLTKAVMDLVEEEMQIYRDTEDMIVLKLRKMLMMAKHNRIRLSLLRFSCREFGFPKDIETRLVPSYPQYFRVVREGEARYLELVQWDDSLAVSVFEKKVKDEARKAGQGEIETRGQSLAFKVSFSPGMFLKKKNFELFEKWQKLPYISPYQDSSWVRPGTFLADRRAVAVVHELLCFTVEKKSMVVSIARLKHDFGLPGVAKLVHRFPGIFYMSNKGDVKTAVLREGYEGGELLEDHPLIHLKEKYIQMVREAPRLCAELAQKRKEARERQFAASLEAAEETDSADSCTDVSDSEYDGETGVNEDGEDTDSEEQDEVRGGVVTNHPSKLQKEIW